MQLQAPMQRQSAPSEAKDQTIKPVKAGSKRNRYLHREKPRQQELTGATLFLNLREANSGGHVNVRKS